MLQHEISRPEEIKGKHITSVSHVHISCTIFDVMGEDIITVFVDIRLSMNECICISYIYKLSCEFNSFWTVTESLFAKFWRCDVHHA